MTEINYKIFHHNDFLDYLTTNKALEYKQKITIRNKDYIVIDSPMLKYNKASVITADRYDYVGDKLAVNDIVEVDDCFYKIGSLCPDEDKEYVVYLNLDGSLHETTYAGFCVKLDTDMYNRLKADYSKMLNDLEKAYSLMKNNKC